MFYKSIINQLHHLISSENEPNEESLIIQGELISRLMGENFKLRRKIEADKLYLVHGIKIGTILKHKEAKERLVEVTGFDFADFRITSISTSCLNKDGKKTSREISININRLYDYKIIEKEAI
jgi:hypothetical protein